MNALQRRRDLQQFPFSALPPELMLIIFDCMPDLELILAQVCRLWRLLILRNRTELNLMAAVRLHTWCLHNKDDRLVTYTKNCRNMASMINVCNLTRVPFWKICPSFFLKVFQKLENLLKFLGWLLGSIETFRVTPMVSAEFGASYRRQMIFNDYDEKIFTLSRVVIEKQDPLMLARFFTAHLIKPVYVHWAITGDWMISAKWLLKQETSEFLWSHRIYYLVCATKAKRLEFSTWLYRYLEKLKPGAVQRAFENMNLCGPQQCESLEDFISLFFSF